MKKILIFANSSWYIKNFKFNLIKELKKNYEILLILPDGKYKNFFDKNNVNYLILKNFKPFSKNIFNEILIFVKLFFIYKKYNPNLSMHYTIKPNIYGSLISYVLNIKSLNNITGLGNIFINDSFLNKIIRKIYFLTQKFTSFIIFQNKYDYKLFNNYLSFNQSAIIESSGVDTDYFKPLNKLRNDNNYSFLMISRIIKEKGIIEFLEAAKIISNFYNNSSIKINFILIGENYKDELFKKVTLYATSGYIKYKEHTENTRKYFNDASCVILPSYREGSSKFLIEASSMGKPILASNVPGCNNIVSENINGYLFESQNVNSLVDKIYKFIKTDKYDKKSMSKNSRELAIEKYDIKIVDLKHINIINNLIKDL